MTETAAAEQIQSPASMASGRTSFSKEELLALRLHSMNDTEGKLTGYDCQICKNRGYNAFLSETEEIVWRPCACMKIRNSMRHIRDSGLENALSHKTFAKYTAHQMWQCQARETASNYTHDDTGAWLFMAGSNGAGKTHLCTAACGVLLKRGIDVRYMLWLDEIQRLKAAKTEDGYQDLMAPWKQATVLYIDDLFKTKRGADVTDADVRIAFELLNYRYMDMRKKTIISSERSLEQLIDIDEGIGGRIRERSRGYYVFFSGKKDWRLQK